MEDLTHVELSDLYDLLAQQTTRYMKMLSEGATKQEFDQCREIIISIQAEIQSRKNQQSRDKTDASTNFHENPVINRTKN
jgi:multidrug resistance efflux pump